MRKQKLIRRARAMRREPTRSEEALWALLRAHRLNGWGFRRQADVGGYVVDFVCHDLKLIVECDGPAHDDGEQQAFDAVRDAKHKGMSFTVLRLADDLAIKTPEQAAAWIKFVGERLEQGLPAFPDIKE